MTTQFLSPLAQAQEDLKGGPAWNPYSNSVSTMNGNGPVLKDAAIVATILSGTKVVTVTIPNGFSFLDKTSYNGIAGEISVSNADASGETYAIEPISGTQFKVHASANTGADTKVFCILQGQ